MKTKCILTFDVEFWYCGTFMGKYLPEESMIQDQNDCSRESLDLILDLLKTKKQTATFFVLGKFAQKYPQLIKKISDDGHEIAAHGYSHKPVRLMAEGELRNEIVISNEILKNITQKDIMGFRAPNFSLDGKMEWAINIISDNFKYDSSLHPLSLKKSLRGINELPTTIGGFYFRVLPLFAYIALVKLSSKSTIPMVYFHPYELFNFTPKITSGPWYKRKIKYLGIKNAWNKFKKLSDHFDFISINQYINEHSLN